MQSQAMIETTQMIDEARRLGNHKTKRETINAALKEYIQRRKQMEIINLFGTIEYLEDYDYKAERCRKRS